MKYFPFFILLGALLISCEKYIDMEIPDNGRKIVINSIYNDNTDIVINLTMSRFILDNSDYKPLSGATVELYENDVFIGNLNESEAGMYISSGFRATTGSKQKIIISKGDQTITAISYLPNKVPITFIDTTRVQKDYMKLLRFRFSVSDPSTTDNFYMIGFAMEDSLTQGLMERYSIYFYTDDPFIEKTGTEAYGVFSDESFKGQTKTLAIDIDLYNFSADTTDRKSVV